jgi:Tol biopolymer transport system component
VVTPLSLEKGVERRAVWSPDGKSVAYAANESAGAGPRLFVRDLDAAIARPITGELTNPRVNQWTNEGRIIYAEGASLWSISPVSAVPERIDGLDISEVLTGAVARDGTAAIVRRDESGDWAVWTTPLSAVALRKYEGLPLGSARPVNLGLEFSNDGRQLLLTWVVPPEQIWVLPLPEDDRRPPRRVLEGLPPILGNGVAWMPDNVHLVVGTSDPRTTTAPQLSIADTRSGSFRTLTNDGSGKAAPAVSPDGNRLVFLDQDVDFDIVTVALAGAELQPLIATDNREEQARWSARVPAMAYTTTRRGHYEIWLHRTGEVDRPLVTPSDFATRQWLLSPSPSPDGERVIFQAVDWQTGESHLWVRSTAGGSLERVTNGAPSERAGSWSPDGAFYVYWTREPDGTDTLKKVRTSGRASPETLLTGAPPSPILPLWSPDGHWILVADRFLKLVSTDGKATRELPIEGAPCGFALAGARIYCLRAPQADGRRPLVALDFDGAVVEVVGSLTDDRAPRTSAGPLAPSLTLSLAPDGSSVTYSVVNQSASLWLMEGLSQAPLP